MIRTIYEQEPNFPASDQHPDAVRYQVGRWWVDVIGAEPTEAEVEALVNPPNAAIDSQIAAIEAREMAPRFSREAVLIGIVKDHMRDYSVDAATAISELTTVGGQRFSHGFAKLKALDDQIKALRAQRQP